jgi:Iron-sulfur cluster-binding domain
MPNLPGISTVSVELTSRCNKSCAPCGRRKLEKDYPHLCDWGDMGWDMVNHIARQIPPGVVVQLHNNGEPTLYPRLGGAIQAFKAQKATTSFNTNGKLLIEKASDIIGNLDTLALSVIQDDPEGEEQKAIFKEFLKLKGKDVRPWITIRALGEVDLRQWKWVETQGYGKIATRPLHDPMGSRDYEKPATIPGIGICLDLLHHLAIDRYGNVSICVRFDPEGLGRCGHVDNASLEEIATSQQTRSWHKHPRQRWIELHKRGRRDEVPLCKTCDYWGVPRGRE